MLVVLVARADHVSFRESADGPAARRPGRRARALLQPFEVAVERVARPFRDAYGWTTSLFDARSRERAAARRERAAAPAGHPERVGAAARTSSSSACSTTSDAPAFPHDFTGVAAEVIAPPAERLRAGRSSSRPARTTASRSTPRSSPRDGLVGQVTQRAEQRRARHAAHRRGERRLGARPATRASGIVRHGAVAATRSSSTASRRRRSCRSATRSSPPAGARAGSPRSTRGASRSAASRASASSTPTSASRSRSSRTSTSRPLDSVLVLVARGPAPRLAVSALDNAAVAPDRLRRRPAPGGARSRRLDVARRHRRRAPARRLLAHRAAPRLGRRRASRGFFGGLLLDVTTLDTLGVTSLLLALGGLLDRPLRRDDRAATVRTRRSSPCSSSRSLIAVARLRPPLPARRGGLGAARALRDAAADARAEPAPRRAGLRALPRRAPAGRRRPSARRRCGSLASSFQERRVPVAALPAARPARRRAVPPHAAARAPGRRARRARARRVRDRSSSGSGRCRCSPATATCDAAQNNQLRTVRGRGAARARSSTATATTIVSNVPGTAVQIWTGDLPEEGRYAMLKRLSRILRRAAAAADARRSRQRKDDPLTPITVKTAVHEDQVAYLYEHRAEFPGVEIVGTYLRDYEYRALAAQLLGYVGEISPEELEGSSATDYRAGDKIGKAGVEAAFDALPARRRGRGADPRRLARPPAGAARAAPAGAAGQRRPPDDRHRPAARRRARAPRGHRARRRAGRVLERERRRDRRARPARRRRARDGLEPDLQAVRLRRARRPEEARAARRSTGSRRSANFPGSTARSRASIRPARRSSR